MTQIDWSEMYAYRHSVTEVLTWATRRNELRDTGHETTEVWGRIRGITIWVLPPTVFHPVPLISVDGFVDVDQWFAVQESINFLAQKWAEIIGERT